MPTVTAGYQWASGETVTPTKLNSAATPTVVIDDAEITTAKIVDAGVTNSKLASDIDAAKLTTGTLPIARIADAAVTGAKLSGAQAGSAPIYGIRAWVTFNGTNGSIVGQGNVSGVTRNGLGLYTINFSTAMPDTAYAFVATARRDNNTASSSTVVTANNSSAKTTSSFQIKTIFHDSGGGAGLVDAPEINVLIIR
jgi:hypothetical protein